MISHRSTSGVGGGVYSLSNFNGDRSHAYSLFRVDSAILTGMTAPSDNRWYRLTPDRIVIGLLVVEGLLWLSEWFPWLDLNRYQSWTALIAVATVGVAMLLMLVGLLVSLFFRLRFQFSIRTLLALTVAVAIPFSWLAVKIKKAREQESASTAIAELGGQVFSTPSGPAWLRRMLGHDLFTTVHAVWFRGVQVTDDGLEGLDGLSQPDEVRISRSGITDTGLKHLKNLKHLQLLELSDNRITGEGLENLSGLNEIQTLDLECSDITDAGLQHLKGLSRLINLDLDSTQITDAGLEHLKGRSNLLASSVCGTKVTREVAEKLQQALPNCHVYWGGDDFYKLNPHFIKGI